MAQPGDKSSKKKNPHAGHRSRLREQARKNGLESLHPHQIIELLLFTPIKRKDTNELAHEIIDHCGGFVNVFESSVEKLTEVDGVGHNTAVYLRLLQSMYAKYGGYRNVGNIRLNNPLVADAYYSECFDPQAGDQLAVTVVDNTLAVLNNYRMKYTSNPEERPWLTRNIVSEAFNIANNGCILAQYSPKDGVSEQDIAAARALLENLSPVLRVYEFLFLRNGGIAGVLSNRQ